MCAGESWVVLAGLLILTMRGLVRPAVAAVLSAGTAALAGQLLKNVFDRARPDPHLVLVHLRDNAMPSTHAAWTAAAGVAAAVGMRCSTRRAGAVAAAVAATVCLLLGVFMVYLGAHWLTDVLAGWALGALVGGVIGVRLRSWPATQGSGIPPARVIGCTDEE